MDTMTLNTPYPELMIHVDPTALDTWNAANQKAIDEYAEHPFIDGRMGKATK
jgi:hypothetical protein